MSFVSGFPPGRKLGLMALLEAIRYLRTGSVVCFSNRGESYRNVTCLASGLNQKGFMQWPLCQSMTVQVTNQLYHKVAIMN